MKNLEHYLNLEYPYTINPLSVEDGSGWVVEFLDLKGILGTGDTIDEAIQDAMNAKEGWFEICIRENKDIPEPWSHQKRYSGNFALRMPKSMHEWVVKEAEKEGISVNQHINYLLAAVKGKRQK